MAESAVGSRFVSKIRRPLSEINALATALSMATSTTPPPLPGTAPRTTRSSPPWQRCQSLLPRRALISQVQQRGKHVFLDCAHRRHGQFLADSLLGQLVAQSSTMRSAVFLPMPGMRVSRAMSFPRIAPAISSAGMPLRIVIASLGQSRSQ